MGLFTVQKSPELSSFALLWASTVERSKMQLTAITDFILLPLDVASGVKLRTLIAPTTKPSHSSWVFHLRCLSSRSV